MAPLKRVVAVEHVARLNLIAKMEDITVREEPLVKQTKKGERTYYRWVASWREGAKTRKVYLGIVKKLGQAEALQKAKVMKAYPFRELGVPHVNPALALEESLKMMEKM